MDSDIILLNRIYHNSINAINAISVLLKKTESEALFDCLFAEMVGYRKIADKANTLLKNRSSKPSVPNLFDRFSFFVGIKVASGAHTSQRRIAKLLINGSLEGIYDISDFVNSCISAHKESRELAYSLIEAEQKNICNMQKILEKSRL